MQGTCSSCRGNGARGFYDEHGHFEKGDCYKCLGTGKASESDVERHRDGVVLEAIAASMTSSQERSASENPDGEDWGFAAAENMVSIGEYRDHRFWDNMEVVMKGLKGLDPGILLALKDLLAPKKIVASVPVVPESSDVPF